MVRWLRPEPCGGAGADVLSPAQVQHWRERGYVVVDRLWPADLVAAAGAEMDALALAAERRKADPGPARSPFDMDGVGRQAIIGFQEFPTKSPSFNACTLHPRWLQAAVPYPHASSHPAAAGPLLTRLCAGSAARGQPGERPATHAGLTGPRSC